MRGVVCLLRAAIISSGDRGSGTPKIGALSRGSGAPQILWRFDGYGPSHAAPRSSGDSQLASILREGRKSANIHLSSGIIWGTWIQRSPGKV